MSHKIRVTSLLSSENISVWHKLNQRPGRDTGPSRPSSAEVKNRVLSLRASVAYERVKPTYILNQIRHSSITTLCLLSGFTTGTNSKVQHSVVWGHAVWWTGMPAWIRKRMAVSRTLLTAVPYLPKYKISALALLTSHFLCRQPKPFGRSYLPNYTVSHPVSLFNTHRRHLLLQ